MSVSTLGHAEIARLIPHAGAMALLDRIVAWDAERITSIAVGHRDPAHPLRDNDGALPAVAAIEYASQAMAAHGGLLARAAAPTHAAPRVGMLAAVRDVRFHVRRLDTVADDLHIDAVRLSGEGVHVLYAFSVRAGARVLAEGRAAVVLDTAVRPR